MFVLLVGVYMLVSPGTPAAQSVGDFTILVAVAVAACSCAAAARRAAVDRRAWAFLTVGASLWVGGQLAWTFYGITRDHAYPFPSLADVGYLGLAPFAVLALFLFRRTAQRQTAPVRALLDAAVIALATAFVSYTTVLGTVVGDSHAGHRFVGVIEAA